MHATQATRWLVFSAATVAAALAGTRSVAADSRTREVVVLYDDARTSVAVLDAALAKGVVPRERGATHLRALRAGAGPRLSAVTWSVPDAAAEARALATLQQLPGVAHAAPNRSWRTRGAPRNIPILLGDDDDDEQSVVQQPAVDQINASHAGGAGVTVAVLDGGFDLGHEMLVGHIAAGGYDTLDGDAVVQDTGDGIDGDGDGNIDDMVGHGTFVAGLVLAVAPDAKILPMRVLDDEGQGTDLALWLAISRAVDEGADVINMSMVVPSMPQAMQSEIDAARTAGIVFVTAAGNERTGPHDDPDLVARALVVGGVDGSDAVLSWSPTGQDVEIYAPAENVLGPLGGATANSYASWSGTSFACALVSGAAALVREADAALGPAAVESLLATETATVTGDTGSGRLDVGAAVDSIP